MLAAAVCGAMLLAGAPARAIAPAAPSNLVSAADSPSQVTLTWADTATNESGFRIEAAAATTGTWSQIGRASANVTSYANTGLTANALWYYRVCATNVDGASAYANVANAHAEHYQTAGGTPVWRGLLLVYTNTDVTIGGTNYAFTMTPSRVSEGLNSFRWGMGRLHEHSLHRGLMVYDIVYPTHPVTNVSTYGSGYWLAPGDISDEINAYAPKGSYDSIFTYWEKGTLSGGGAWGLSYNNPSAAANGATYTMVNTLGVPSAWDKCDVWWHEWLHPGCGFYEDRGYRQPSGGPDGAGGHGYTNDAAEGWGLYYRDIQLDLCWETDDFTGIPQQGWFGGSVCDNRMSVQFDNFYMDTSTRYQKSGTIAWRSTNETMVLGTASPAENAMYTTLTVTGVPKMTASAIMYVPGSGVGTGDVVAVALRNATNTWWGQIEYGTNMTKRLRLLRDGVSQATYSMSVTTGWYTVELDVDLNADNIGMKAWVDGTQEPASAQLSASLATGWSPTQIGFRHFGQGVQVDDLIVTTPPPPPRFTNMVASLPGIELGAARWGDYDNDGDLDVLMVGMTDTGRIGAIYRNDGGSFTNIGALLPALNEADADWGDYDNDGDLDILIAGNTGSGYFARIYRNDGGGTFTDIAAGLQAVLSARVAWGDYDNDGDIDILVTGWGGTQKSIVYRNDGGGVFTDINAGLVGSEKGVAKWGDYDNDGDLDILLAGYTGSAYSTKIYRNDGGVFTDIGASLHNLGYASGAWGDYDNDGDLDFAITGFDGSGRVTEIYRNDGGAFTNINAGLPGVADSDIAWGDYDNDGDLDLVYGGYPISTHLCRNDGGGVFLAINTPLAAVRNCSVAWGDYDRDGKLDILLSGFDGATRVAGIYRNMDDGIVSNTPPAASSGLVAVTNGLGVTLSWSAASDGQTPANGLTYNVRAGTTPGGSDVMAPMANTTSGWRRVPAMGNAQHGLNARLTTLPPAQTIYWSVQAVDSALVGGAFSSEASFVAPELPSVTTAPVTNIAATSASCGGNVTNAGTAAVTSRGCVWNTSGGPTIENRVGMTTNGSGLGTFVSSLTGLSSGQTYFVRAYASNSVGVAYGQERVFMTPGAGSGNLLALDGTNDYVSIADSDALDLTTNHTLELWFKADSVSGLRGLISKYHTNSANGWYLRLNGSEAQFDGLSTSGLNVQTGRWYHLAGVKNGASFTLYVNGVSVAVTGTGNTQINNDPVRIGSDYSGRYFDGQIDELRIWNVARTTDEIRDDMHRALSGSEAGLTAFYRFDQTGGTLLYDATGSGRDGSVMNAPVWMDSDFPCAAAITNRFNLRGVWPARTNSLPSGRLSILDGDVAGADFVVFGHDNVAETENASDKPAHVQWRLNRVWQIEETGSLTSDLRFDVSGWTNRFALLADDDGVFANATVIGGALSGTNITAAAVGLQSGQYFTLGSILPPSVATDPVTSTGKYSATGGGNVTSDSGLSVTARGVCWSTSTNPTTANPCTTNGTGTGAFAGSLSGLAPNTLYHVRAYAANIAGTSYGEDVQFTTLVALPPSLTTATPSNITTTTAACGGNVTSEGTAPVTARGCVWNTAGNPSLTNNTGVTSDGSGPGAFDSLLTGLTSGQVYYVRAYATNEDGTAYGGQQVFAMPMAPPGRALDFDGANDHVLVADDTRLDMTNNYTLECWFKADGFGGLRGLITKYQTGGANGWLLRLNGTELDFDQLVTSGLGLQAGRWYHVAAVNSNGTRQLFVNGASRALSGTATPVAANGDPVRIGSDFGGRYFDGQIDEVRIWDVVRTEDDIRDQMHKVCGGSEAGLRAYYRLDCISGATAFETTTNALIGTLQNMDNSDWIASTMPCAVGITNRFNLRGAWLSNRLSPPSGRMSTTNAVASGTDFAIFGHDSAAETQNSSDKPGLANWRLERVWKVEQTGAVTADVRFDTSGLAGPFALLADADGVFSDSSLVGGLSDGTSFVARAVALQDGWHYTLAQVDTPQVTTTPISNITWSSALGGGNVTNQGGSAVTARGAVWGTNSNPTLDVNDGATTNGGGAGAFASSLTKLAERRTYYVRAYASNSQGTGYGNEVSFTSAMNPPGNGLDFDGINDKAASFGDIGPIPTNEVTVEAWVQLDDVARDGKIVSRASGLTGYEGYILGTYNGMLYAEAWDTAGTHYTFTAGTVIAGRWTHLAMVYQRNNALIAYVNGVEVGRTNVANLALRVHSQNGVNIGVAPGSFASYTDGRIDEVRVWHIARTEEQIRDDMHRTLSGSEAGLSACYAFDQTSGSTVADLTPVGSTYANLYNMSDANWVRSGWPCALVIDDWNNLRAVWIDRTNSLDSSVMSFAPPSVTGTNCAFMGHNGAPLAKNVTDTPTSLYWRLDRAWQPESRGVTNGVVQFDCAPISSLIADPALLRLLVDDDGAFTNANVLTGTYTDGVFSVAGQTFATGIFYTVGEIVSLPAVTTAPVSNVTHNSASGGGEVTIEGAGTITARGVCWSTFTNPTTAGSHTTDGSGLGAFNSVLSGLTPGTTYYVRAYAVNVSGTAYGGQRTLTTSNAPPGNALDFDGTNDFVDLGTSDALALTNGAFTIETWIRPTAKSNITTIVGRKNGGGANPGYAFYYNNWTTMDRRLILETKGTSCGTVDPVINWDVWQHVALTWNGSTLRFYVNGTERPSAGSVNLTNGNVRAVLGSFSSGTLYYDGQMDETRIWNVTRTEAELRDAMHKVLFGNEAGLIAYYRFDSSGGTTLPDLSPSHFDGVLSNGPVWVASSYPCAIAIDGRANLRGAWIAQTGSLASSIFSVTNSAVTGVNYRVFGHDNGALTNSTSDAPPSCAWRLGRAWQLEGTGPLSGTLVFDCAAITNLIGDASRLRLLSDADGSFTNAASATGTYAAARFTVAGQSVPPYGFYTIGEHALRTITATAGANGTINPTGAVQVLHGGTTNFAITPAAYWHVGDVTTNGASVGVVTNFTWNNVIADGTINATFAANLATNGTPHWWLAQYGLTNDGFTFDQAETNKSDSDAFDNGQEYIANTDPTNPASYFHVIAISNKAPFTFTFDSSGGRLYTMQAITNLMTGAWTNVPNAGPRLGLGIGDCMTDSNQPPVGSNYRIKVQLP